MVGVALRSAGLSAMGEVSETLQPLPLDTRGGGVALSKLKENRESERAALSAGDYRLAAEMRDLHSVLSPGTAEDLQDLDARFPLADTEAQARFFYRFGFCILPAAFVGEHLQRLRAAWRRNQRPQREAWLAKASAEEHAASRGRSATYFDVPSAKLFGGLSAQLDQGAGADAPDAVLLDLVDPQPLVALLQRLLVHDQWSSLRMGGLFQPRTYPPREDSGGDARGYIGWHRDRDGPGIGLSCNPGAIVKVFTYLEDVHENGGPTTVVPGSNALTFDPRDAFTMTTDGVPIKLSGAPADNDWSNRPLSDDWTANTYKVQPQSAMPNAHRLVCKAGDVALFDTSTWHTASPNYSDRDREAVIINYTAGELGSSPANFPIPLELMERCEAAGLISEERRRILGMPRCER